MMGRPQIPRTGSSRQGSHFELYRIPERGTLATLVAPVDVVTFDSYFLRKSKCLTNRAGARMVCCGGSSH